MAAIAERETLSAPGPEIFHPSSFLRPLGDKLISLKGKAIRVASEAMHDVLFYTVVLGVPISAYLLTGNGFLTLGTLAATSTLGSPIEEIIEDRFFQPLN